MSQREKFKYQLSLIKKAFVKGTILLGDFKLDYWNIHCVNCSSNSLFEDFEEILCDLDLIQLVECATWSRIVNNHFKESLLDHIYVTDPTVCISIKTIKPCFGDHLLIIMELMLIKPHVEMTLKKRLEIVFERCIIQTVQYKGAFTWMAKSKPNFNISTNLLWNF